MSLLRNLASRAVTPQAPAPAPEPVETTIAPRVRPRPPAYARPPAPEARDTTLVNPHNAAPIIPQGYVLDLIDRWDRRPNTSRDGGTAGMMHVSNLISMACMRKAALMAQHEIVHTETVTGGHRIMWAQGRATEAHIRESVIGSSEGSIVYGKWTCVCGHAFHVGLRPDARNICTKCEHPMHTYKEVTLVDADNRITGNPDLPLMLSGRILVIEIKSMTPDQFDDLARPLPDHVNQALMYRELFKRGGFPVFDKVVILYGRKQFRWGGAKGDDGRRVYKEFHVDATSAVAVDMVETCFQLAGQLARHYAARTLPERKVCNSAACKKAKSCPVVHLCFQMR